MDDDGTLIQSNCQKSQVPHKIANLHQLRTALGVKVRDLILCKISKELTSLPKIL